MAQHFPANARDRRRGFAGAAIFFLHGPRHFIRHVPIARANRRGKGDVVQAAVNNIIRAAFIQTQVGVDIFKRTVVAQIVQVSGADGRLVSIGYIYLKISEGFFSLSSLITFKEYLP